MFAKLSLFLALSTIVYAIPAPSVYKEDVEDLQQYVPSEEAIDFQPLYLVRTRREIEFNPHVNKQDGTTNVGATATHRGDNHEVTGHWNKNVRGPNRSRPNYGVRGSFKW